MSINSSLSRELLKLIVTNCCSGEGDGPMTCRFLRQTRFSVSTRIFGSVCEVVIGSSADDTTASRQLCVAADGGTVQSQETITGRFGSSVAIVCAGPIGCQSGFAGRLKFGGVKAVGNAGSP